MLLLFVSDIFRWMLRSFFFDFSCPYTGMTSDLIEMWQCGFVWNHRTKIRKLPFWEVAYNKALIGIPSGFEA